MRMHMDLKHCCACLQVVVTYIEPHPGSPGEEGAVVDIEELRFLAPDGALLIEYGLAFSLDNSHCSTRAVRLGDGTGFGRLQGRRLAEATAHFEGLRAAAEQQPLRAAGGRWSDGLLLPAIHAAVTEMYLLQH